MDKAIFLALSTSAKNQYVPRLIFAEESSDEELLPDMEPNELWIFDQRRRRKQWLKQFCLLLEKYRTIPATSKYRSLIPKEWAVPYCLVCSHLLGIWHNSQIQVSNSICDNLHDQLKWVILQICFLLVKSEIPGSVYETSIKHFHICILGD